MVDVGAHQPLRERLGPVPATAVLASDMTVNVVSVGMVVLAPAMAGAQTTTTLVPGEGAPPVPGDCTFDVTPNPVAALTRTEFDGLFDIGYYLKNIDGVIDRVFGSKGGKG